MFKVGEQVCHSRFPEEYGLGIMKKIEGDNVVVLWEDEFGTQWEETVDISDIE